MVDVEEEEEVSVPSRVECNIARILDVGHEDVVHSDHAIIIDPKLSLVIMGN